MSSKRRYTKALSKEKKKMMESEPQKVKKRKKRRGQHTHTQHFPSLGKGDNPSKIVSRKRYVVDPKGLSRSKKQVTKKTYVDKKTGKEADLGYDRATARTVGTRRYNVGVETETKGGKRKRRYSITAGGKSYAGKTRVKRINSKKHRKKSARVFKRLGPK
jgi:hypothetical protein